MKKKILSLLVTMGLAASLVPVSVFADGTEVWDGSVAESFAGGKGTKDDPYQIATGSQLAYFAKRENAEEYGEKYAEYYVSVYYAQRLTFSLFLVDVFMFLLCVCSPKDRLMMVVLMLVVLAVVNYYFIVLLSEKIKKNSDRYLLQFPNVASTMALLINAGMIVTEAWEVIAYEDEDELHKQMQITMEEIENGVSLKMALYRFANRCATPELRKFTSSIIQGMEKGNKELAEMLSDMSKELWHTKKQRVIQLAELAGNKVLIPIMMMFVGILIMVMVPIVTNMF